MELQVDKNHYFQERYADLRRFISYYYQIDFIRKTEAKKILFVGVGDGLVPDYLKKIPGIELITFDIDQELNPDIVGDVINLPFKDNEFDCVVICQVLEHIPFDYFSKILSRIHQITRKWVVLSLPVRQVGFECILRFPFIRKILKRSFLRIAQNILTKFPYSSHHHWVVDRKSVNRINKEIENHFQVMRKENIMLGINQYIYMLNKK
ncbi:MAG TPA: methyltransferase domain-containing protein [Candidatus Paceibacterota bacterium]|nr:methyltransferase domain-containing protein [Candidatus Paceibacterota bacterium]